MKIKLTLLALLLAPAAVSSAAVLNATTAVHTKPDEASPAIAVLNAGSEPTVAKDAIATTPAGWLAIELPGPFEGYVLNQELMKSLDPKPGATVYLRPTKDAPVLTTFEPGDKSQVTGLRGRYTQFKIEKKIVAYIHLGNAPGYLPPIATTPATSATAPTSPSDATLSDTAAPAPAPAAPEPAPMSPAPVVPTARGAAAPGQTAPVFNLGDASGATLPHLFAGKFITTRSPFRPRRPYDWALVDDAGGRIAYLDMTKVPLTEQIKSYLNHQVVISGTARPFAEGKDLVIGVESVQLK